MSREHHTYILVSNDILHDQRMHRLSDYLHDQGQNVHIIGRARKGQKALESKPYKQTRLKTWIEKGPLFYAILNMRMMMILLFKPIDTLVCVDLDTIVVGRFLKTVKSFYFVFDAHEWFTEVPELLHKPRIKGFWQWIADRCIPHTDTRMTVNPSLAEVFAKQYNLPFYVIYNAPILQDNASKTKHQSDLPYLIYQGAINEGRGLESLVEAMDLLPDYALYILGNGDIEDRIAQLIANGKSSDRIKMLGALSREKMDTYTRGARVGVNLLDGQSLNYQYSLANKFFDYIHAEIPAIHMDFVEYRVIMDKYPVGVLIQDLDPQTIADAIKQISIPNNYSNCLLSCKNAKQVYQWDTNRVVLEKVFCDTHPLNRH
jgi:glycosyltransferase involved in cell wall biosynthesis